MILRIVSDIVAASSDSNVASVTGFKVFRMIRLTRIVKTVRVVRLVRFVIALRTLVSSIVHTLKALFWALTLLGLIVYVFAVLFAQAAPWHFRSSSPYAEAYDHHIDPASTMSIEEDAAREKYFQSLPIAMLSLFMSIAGLSFYDNSPLVRWCQLGGCDLSPQGPRPLLGPCFPLLRILASESASQSGFISCKVLLHTVLRSLLRTLLFSTS